MCCSRNACQRSARRSASAYQVTAHVLDVGGSFPGINRDGGFADLLKTSARSVVKLDTGLEPKDIAALADAGLTAIHAVKKAIPILTVAQLVGNGSRVWFNRRELDLAVMRWYTLGAVPLALAGGYLFAQAPLSALTRATSGIVGAG